MRAFAEAFFTRFRAQAFPLDDELVVDLPPDLAAVFGKPRLYLVFAEDGNRRELSPAEDLLVYGGRVFDHMLALLEGRGEVTYLRLAAQFPDEPTGLPFLPLYNCQVVECQTHSADAQFYAFNFRVAYLSDEKREEFITAVLDSAGHPRPDKLGVLADGAGFLSPDPLLAPRPQIRPDTFDRAVETARQQAEARAIELEAAIQPRLQRALLRLTTFYRRMADEVDSGDPAQDEIVRADLERDLARKIADELERHRLRISLAPLSYAVALLPVVHYRLTLATRYTRRSLELERELHTGQLEPLPCQHCHQPVQQLALCDRGAHLVHPHCLDTCSACGHDICHACGIQPCAACTNLVCLDCVAICDHCDRWLCADHVHACAVCSQPVCDQCATLCPACGLTQCRAHLAPCLTCGALICEEDRWPCHVCGQESCPTHAGLCPICGEPYCVEHAFGCASCEQVYCVRCGIDGQCYTCRQAVSSPPIPPRAVPRAPGIRPALYEWQRADNRDLMVYRGQSWLGQAVVVTDRSGALVYHRKSGLLQTLIKGLSRQRQGPVDYPPAQNRRSV